MSKYVDARDYVSNRFFTPSQRAREILKKEYDIKMCVKACICFHCGSNLSALMEGQWRECEKCQLKFSV